MPFVEEFTENRSRDSLVITSYLSLVNLSHGGRMLPGLIFYRPDITHYKYRIIIFWLIKLVNHGLSQCMRILSASVWRAPYG